MTAPRERVTLECMEGALIAETMVSHVSPSSAQACEEMCAPGLESESRHHARAIGEASSDNKRSERTSAFGDERPRTAHVITLQFLNSAQLLSRATGDIYVQRISYAGGGVKRGERGGAQAMGGLLTASMAVDAAAHVALHGRQGS